MLGASDQPLEQLPTMPKSSELIFSALQFNDAKVNAIHLNQFLKKSFDQNCIPFVGIFLKRYNMGGNCVSCQLFWAFLFDNASDICIRVGLDQKNMKPGMIHQNKIIWSHFIGKAISLIKTKAAASTDQRLSDRISFCQMLTSTGAVS